MVETDSVIRSRMAKSSVASRAGKQKRKHQTCDMSVKTSTTKTKQFEARLNPPPGHVFVPKGDRYVSRHCNLLAATQDVFIPESSTRVGLYVPTDVCKQVQAMAEATVEQRTANVERKDERDRAQAMVTMHRLFPRAPAKEVEMAVAQAYLKRSGRVGRTSLLTAEHKARLAMTAHIRHSKTCYDQLLHTGVARSEARKRVEQVVLQTTNVWHGKYVAAAAVYKDTTEVPVKQPLVVPPPLMSQVQDKMHKHPAARTGMARSPGDVPRCGQARHMLKELDLISQRHRRRRRKLKRKLAMELGGGDRNSER